MIKKMNLSWIAVADLDKAIEYYTEVLGLKVLEKRAEFGWAELGAPEGDAVLGLAQEKNPTFGKNAVVTFCVRNMSKALEEYKKKGLKFLGEVVEVPGQVKLQTCQDEDGNTFQLVEELS